MFAQQDFVTMKKNEKRKMDATVGIFINWTKSVSEKDGFLCVVSRHCIYVYTHTHTIIMYDRSRVKLCRTTKHINGGGWQGEVGRYREGNTTYTISLYGNFIRESFLYVQSHEALLRDQLTRPSVIYLTGFCVSEKLTIFWNNIFTWVFLSFGGKFHENRNTVCLCKYTNTPTYAKWRCANFLFCFAFWRKGFSV